MRGALRRPHQEPDKEDTRQKSERGMRPAPSNQPTAPLDEILRECGAERRRGEERVPQRCEGSGDADCEQHEEAHCCAYRRYKPEIVAQVASFAAEKMRCEGEGGKQQQGVGQVQSQVGSSVWRMTLRGKSELDKQCAKHCLNESKRNGRDCRCTRKMSAYRACIN